MMDGLSHNNKNRSSNVKIISLVAEESNFGKLYNEGNERCFYNDFEGRKSFELSARPSAEWVKKFNNTFNSKGFLLQPHKKRIYALVRNDNMLRILQNLNKKIEDINNSFIPDSGERVNNDKESSCEYICRYLKYLGGINIPVVNKDVRP